MHGLEVGQAHPRDSGQYVQRYFGITGASSSIAEDSWHDGTEKCPRFENILEWQLSQHFFSAI